MSSKSQMTGMRGVYLVAAELAKRELIVSPTSRSARGADLLVTDQACRRAYSVQVKTNTKTFSFWLLSPNVAESVSSTHIYVLVNIRLKKAEEYIEYYVVPSKVVADNIVMSTSKGGKWYSVPLGVVASYKDKWVIFENATIEKPST